MGKYCILLNIILFETLYLHTYAIGISSHIDIAHRAREHFEVLSDGVDYHELLTKHDDAFQAGSPYPDAYYPGLCFQGIYHDISEDTHWSPFINTTVEYIRREYPKPWTEETEKLVVFFLAAISHQVADVSWHSLDIKEGFLQVMGFVNYYGSYSDAHNDGDFGGDVLNLYGLDLDYIGKLRKWYVPTQDLYNIYLDMYGSERMPIDVIENCTALLFLGRLGENIDVVDKLYPLYGKRSTFLLDHLQDYFLGGMDDMAVWSANIWLNAIEMLNKGTDVCDVPHNPLFIRCNTLKLFSQRYKAYKRLKRHLNLVADESIDSLNSEEEVNAFEEQNVFQDIDVEYTERGIYLKPKKSLRKKYRKRKKMLRQRKQHLEKKYDVSNVTEPNYYYSTTSTYSRLGESLQEADFNNDGAMDIAIGAPGYSTDGNIQQGRVYIVYGGEDGLPMGNLDIEDISDATLYRNELNGRFGTALTKADLNADGIDDLVVSAPFVGSDTLQYFGMVYVYFGGPNGIDYEADITIQCLDVYCNLGWTLHGADVNADGVADLLIGAPFAPAGGEQRGLVAVLYASDTYDSKKTELTVDDLDWLSQGSQDFEWFGYSISSVKKPDGPSIVFVGAPAYRDCFLANCSYNVNDVQAVGIIYGFEMPSNSSILSVSGDTEFSQLGFQVESLWHDDVTHLVVSATSLDVLDPEFGNLTQAGVVFDYVVEDDNTLKMNSVIVGDRPFSRLGSHFVIGNWFDDAKLDLLVTAPLRSESYLTLVESGRGYIFQDFFSNNSRISASEADVFLGVQREKLRFGYSIAALDYTEDKMLVVGMPHSNLKGLLAGEVALYTSSL